jgi:hypothetical protein
VFPDYPAPVIRNARRLIASSRVLARAGYLNEWINMDDQDLKLIRQIVASDGRKYTTGWSTWSSG